MSAITLEGKLYILEQDRAFKGSGRGGAFFEAPDGPEPGKLLVIWDGSLRYIAAERSRSFLSLERVLVYEWSSCPARLPISTLTRGSLEASQVRADEQPLLPEPYKELRIELGKAKERLRHKKHVILGCLRQPGCEG